MIIHQRKYAKEVLKRSNMLESNHATSPIEANLKHERNVNGDKYITCFYATCQTIWIELVLKYLKVTVRKPLVLQLDNMLTINLAKNMILHDKSKHIEALFHFLREQMNQKKLEVRHCSNDSQLEDIFSKEVKIDRLLTLKKKLGVVQF